MAKNKCRFCGGDGMSSTYDKFYPECNMDHKCYVWLRDVVKKKGVKWLLARERTLQAWAVRAGFLTDGIARARRPRRKGRAA